MSARQCGEARKYRRYNSWLPVGFRIHFFCLPPSLSASQSLRQRDPGAEGRETRRGRHTGNHVHCSAQTARFLIQGRGKLSFFKEIPTCSDTTAHKKSFSPGIHHRFVLPCEDSKMRADKKLGMARKAKKNHPTQIRGFTKKSKHSLSPTMPFCPGISFGLFDQSRFHPAFHKDNCQKNPPHQP